MKRIVERVFKLIAGKKQKKEDGDQDEEGGIDNKIIKLKQGAGLIAILLVIFLGVVLIAKLAENKAERTQQGAKEEEVVKIELADKAIDGEHLLLKHHEEQLEETKEELSGRIKEIEEKTRELKDEVMEELRRELLSVREQLEAARSELGEAGRQLRSLHEEEQTRADSGVSHREASLDIQNFGDLVEYDKPKPISAYVPEGTYFTGYLLGGVVASTALNSRDENPSTITIVLTSRGNLAKENELDVKECMIQGSAYGDLASERAFVRLEKMICKKDGMYISSKIAGELYGPDGLNGVKGQVVSTGAKHIKNAMIGGVISGFAGNAKGQEGAIISGSGLISTGQKGFGEMAKSGGLTGAANAGEKIADYYLRQAESLSPVLVIPGGVRVNPKIIEGFFVGEVSTHKRIMDQRGVSARDGGRAKQGEQRQYPGNEDEYEQY